MSEPHSDALVFLGATGDLAYKKIFPSLQAMVRRGHLSLPVIGVAKAGWSLDQFKARARESVDKHGGLDPAAFAKLSGLLRYVDGDYQDPATFAALRKALGPAQHPTHYLAIPPALFGVVVEQLGKSGCARGARVVVEKPFGTDLASARTLNHTLHALFDESQVFRIDHFLGKESVDNIVAFRFANGLSEPVWNRKHIAYVQIDVPETLGLEGRGGFYDATGAYRDMIVTHLFQVLGFVAMEPPTSLDVRHLRAETAKVFDALQPIDPANAVRGQYTGYHDEPGVQLGSPTETLAAVRAEVDNWRWAGVPFFLRSGKHLAASRQLITLGFREPPLRMFPVHGSHAPNGRRNEIVIDFADPGSITASFLAKEPGAAMRLGPAEMTFRYADSSGAASTLEGYERLLLDAMLGDQSLFTSADAIERLWEISAPLLDNPPPTQPYSRGSWGPQPALDHLTAPYHWHLPGTNPLSIKH